ncbi:MAG TPA: DUF4832 domain-containing protein, partial [Anaerolineae bacterium]|nr:DUF4832 domain-containing protein [Anaerolineae bacterium]
GFQQTQLIMPYTPWFADSLVYALSRRADIGIRHDALGSAKHQERFREEIGRWVAQRWPEAPIIFEFTTQAYTTEALRRAHDFAQEMHASFIHENFSGRGSNELIDELLAVIGYRLVLRQITHTSELGPGETLQVEMIWENAGVAPPYYQTYPLLLSLTDAQGRSRLEQQLKPDIRRWLPGKEIHLPAKLVLPADLPAGQYDLRVAFIDPVSEEPALTLAITGQDKQGRYLIGPVNVLRREEVSP